MGDIAWGLRQHAGREHEWRIRLWEENGEVVAWSWLKRATAKLDFDVLAGRDELLDELLDEPDARTAFSFADDTELRAALARHGFVPARRDARLSRARPARAARLPPLPDGFRYRTVEPGDLAERVAITATSGRRRG